MGEKGFEKNSLEYIPLCEASKASGYTPEYLNSLARKGKLKARKIGRNWYTTPVWLEDFMSGTKSAKKEKIEEIGSEIHEYCISGKRDHEEKRIESSRSEDAREVKDVSPEEIKTEIREIIRQEKDFKNREKIFQQAEIVFESRWRTANVFATTMLVVFLLVGIFQAGRFINFRDLLPDETDEAFDDGYGGQYPNWISAEGGVVKGEETASGISGEIKGASMASENFQIKEIKFGGAIAMASALENPKLEIYDVRSEVMATKGKEDSRLLVRWKTSRPAISNIEYSAMSGSNPKKLTEDAYGFGHSVVLSNLEPGTAYTYVVTGRDRWANEVFSDRYSAYTGTKTVSVFDLIVNAVKEVFGWAVKE